MGSCGKENMASIDIWRDTCEEKRRQEWTAIATYRRSVREEMDAWKPKSRESAKRMKQSINQIRLDVARTWGTHSAFSTEQGRKALERVLVSWVAHDPVRIGYCQSMNFVAAVVLAVCKGDEDQCLSVFTCLMEDTSFGDFFHRETNFEALHEETQKIEASLKARDVDLMDHFSRIGFQVSSITPTWLLTCFFLPKGPLRAMEVIDGLLKTGKEARICLLQHAVSILLDLRSELLACSEVDDVYRTFKNAKEA